MDVLTAVEIRNLRNRLGLTQARLASLVGVTRNTISRLERGVTNDFELRYMATDALRRIPSSFLLRGIT
jgi:transcriptional regulator with XRE-family HTH domain